MPPNTEPCRSTGGHVDLVTRAAGDRFILTWTEHGGPPVNGVPGRAGFGSSLATLWLRDNWADGWSGTGLRTDYG